MQELELTPTTAEASATWTNEDNALVEADGLWAVNNVNDQGWLVLRDFSGLPSTGSGESNYLCGMTVTLKASLTDANGNPYTPELEKEYRLRVALSSDGGSTWSSTQHVIDCDGAEHTVGDLTSLWGLGSIGPDVAFEDLCIGLQRPTDLADEATGANSRSVEFVKATGAFFNRSVDLVITSAEGGCDGNVDVAWEG